MESSTNYSVVPSGERASFLTVEEAAAVLRIGRTAAYEATRRFRATGGAEGLPVFKVGGTLRVPRHKLEEIAGGAIDFPIEPADSITAQASNRTDVQLATATPLSRSADGDDSDQRPLPFSA